jgi:hypothetical protein
MKLSDWEEKLVEDIDIIFSGGYSENFNEEQIEEVKQLSFLLNHIELKYNSVVFSYDAFNLIVSGIEELPSEWAKEHIIQCIKNSDEFKGAYKLFVRDFTIDKIIKK